MSTRILTQPSVANLIAPLLHDVMMALSAVKGSVTSARDKKYLEKAYAMGAQLMGKETPSQKTSSEAMDEALLRSQREAIRGIFIAMPDTVMSDTNMSHSIKGYERLLQNELALQNIVRPESLVVAATASASSSAASNTSPASLRDQLLSSKIALWQGDMSILSADAVVNPANNALLGCFLPSHRCLDNILHAGAGPSLRIACKDLLSELKISQDANGQCRATSAYCLPSKYVFHTVGPDLGMGFRKPPRAPTDMDRAELQSCYRQCLSKAIEMKLTSIAFCCISTGIFAFPAEEAAQIAVTEVLGMLEAEASKASASSSSSVEALPIVVFNVFKDEDLAIYANLLGDLRNLKKE